MSEEQNLEKLQLLIDLVNKTFTCNSGTYPDLKFLPVERHRNTVIKHSCLHLTKSAGKLASECEDADHGGEFSDESAKKAVLSGFATLLKIASELGMNSEDIYQGVPAVIK